MDLEQVFADLKRTVSDAVDEVKVKVGKVVQPGSPPSETVAPAESSVPSEPAVNDPMVAAGQSNVTDNPPSQVNPETVTQPKPAQPSGGATVDVSDMEGTTPVEEESSGTS